MGRLHLERIAFEMWSVSKAICSKLRTYAVLNPKKRSRRNTKKTYRFLRKSQKILEPLTGIEPVTSSLPRMCSTD